MTVERSNRRCFLTLTFIVKSVSKNLLMRAITKPKIDTVHQKKSTSNRPRAKKGELEMDNSDLFKNIYLKEKEAMFAHVKVTLRRAKKGELEIDNSDLFKNIYLKEKEAMFAHVKVTLEEESKRQFFSLLTSIPFKG